MKNSWLIVIVVAIVVGGGAFYGGMRYGISTVPAVTAGSGTPGAQGGFGGRGGRGGAGGQGGGVSGNVIAKDAQSLTVQSRDGSSHIVFYSTSTTMRKMVDGSINDVLVGGTVTVLGATNSDGSVTAQSIQMRPVGGFGVGGNASSTPNGQ